MIVENNNYICNLNLNLDIKKDYFLQNIRNSIILTADSYILHIKQLKCSHKLEFNENQYCQEFVVLLNRTLRKLELPYGAQREYSDIFTPEANKNRSIDIYFYPIEFDVETKSIYSVEAKRLPIPKPKTRIKEYVIGEHINEGGMERFKNEEHGKGLSECGMLAFVEKNDFDYWYLTINNWINELYSVDNWNICTPLNSFEQNDRYAKSFSQINRGTKPQTIFHFWVAV